MAPYSYCKQLAFRWLLRGFGGSGLGYHSLPGCTFKRRAPKMFYPYSKELWLIVVLVAAAETGVPKMTAEDGSSWQRYVKGQFTPTSAGSSPPLDFTGAAPFCQSEFVICLELKRCPGVGMSFSCSWPFSDTVLDFIYWPSGHEEHGIVLIILTKLVAV